MSAPSAPQDAPRLPEAASFLEWPRGAEKWTPRAIFGIGIYVSLLLVGLLALPTTLHDEIGEHVVITIGAFGVWRFGWWSTHAVRAIIFSRIVYPKMRRAADAVWAEGARPRRLHFMMTTFRERPEITTAVVRSIISEVQALGIGATIWLGSGDASDEDRIAGLVEGEASHLDLDLVIARQDRPGKRYAIGIALRAMRRGGVDPNDVVVFMDGDSVIAPGMAAKCVPLFLADPGLEALTTDEEVVVFGPRWVSIWLTMRFAQRRMAMQSHALSGKVLTLTGRLSLFRANHITRLEFIEMIEEDHLSHWLWGRFRFLSGDDKSTWYYMLCQKARMTYVPDALSVTIEHIEGNGYNRMVQNLRRWSGNMLRNGSRAIALGPRQVGFFIWWCVMDQRLAIWTVLLGPLLAISGAVFLTPAFFTAYVTWVLGTRLMQSLVLWLYSREVSLSYPLLLYTNQFLNAAVKVYCLFRLSKQRWTNRGDQRAGFGVGFADRARNVMAGYLTTVAITGLVISVVTYAELVRLPSSYTVATLLTKVRGP